MPGDQHGSQVQLVAVWEMTVDLTDIGEDGKPFRLIDNAVWWNGLQDQTAGKASDWIAARFDHGVGMANPAIRLPPGKRLSGWGVSDFPSGTRHPFPSAVSRGTYVNFDTGLIFWDIPHPKINQVYKVDWMWEDR